MHQGRALLAGRKRMVRNIVGLFVVAWIVLKTNVVSGFITFCLSGAVPGTHYVLSAGVVVTVAITVIGLMLAKTIWSMHRSRARRRTMAIRQAAREARLQPSGRPVERNMAESHYHQQHFPVAFRLRLAVASGFQRVVDTAALLALIGGEFLQKVGSRLLVGGAKALLLFMIVAGILGRLCIRSVRSVIVTLRVVWRWAEPSLWQLDGWLEVRVKRLQQKTFRWLEGYPPMTVGLAMVKENAEIFKKWRAGRWPVSASQVGEVSTGESSDQQE